MLVGSVDCSVDAFGAVALAVEPTCCLEAGSAMEPTQLSADSLAAKPTSLLDPM